MKNDTTRSSSKLSAIKFIKGIKPKIKKSKASRPSNDFMLFLGHA